MFCLCAGGSFRDLGKKVPFSILTSEEESEASMLKVTVPVPQVQVQGRQVWSLGTFPLYSKCIVQLCFIPGRDTDQAPGHFCWAQAFHHLDPRRCRADTCRDAVSGIPRSLTAETSR